MRLDKEFDRFEAGIKELEEELERLKEQNERIKVNTMRFLRICEKIGIKRVGINTKSDLIKSSMSWRSSGGNAFSDEYEIRENGHEGFPLIWKACKLYDTGLEEEDKISCGCGNSGQYQIMRCALLLDGVYTLENGTWRKEEYDEE